MATSAAQTYGASAARLDPCFHPEDALTIDIKLPNSVTYAKGTVLGEIVGNDEVQTVTIGGSPTGGTFTVTFGGQTTTGVAYNATAATLQTALQALSSIGANNVTVTGSAGGPYTLTFVNALGKQDVAQVTASAAGLTGGSPTITPATTTAGSAGTAGTFKKADPASTDGSQSARALLMYSCSTDSSGNITIEGEWAQTYPTTPVYISGMFRTEDLVGITTTDISNLSACQVKGTVNKGIIRV